MRVDFTVHSGTLSVEHEQNAYKVNAFKPLHSAMYCGGSPGDNQCSGRDDGFKAFRHDKRINAS